MLLLGLMLVGMILETLGVGLVIPVLALMTQPDIIAKYPVVANILAHLSPTEWFAIGTDTVANITTPHGPTHAQVITGGMLVLVGVYSFKALYLAFLAWKQAQFVFGLQASLSQQLFAGYLSQPYTFHLQRNSAQLIRNVTGEVGHFTISILSATLLIAEIMVLFGISTLLVVVEPLGAVLVITTLGLAGFSFHRFTRGRILRWGEARQFHEGQRIQHLQQGLGSVKDIKLLGREDDFIRQYEIHNKGSASMARRQNFLQALPRLWLEWLAIIGLATLIITMIAQGKAMEVLIPTLGLFAASVFRLMPSMNRVLSSVQSLRYSLPAIDLLTEEIQSLRAVKQSVCTTTLPLKKEIKIDYVSFQYPDTPVCAIKDLSVCIPVGSSVGFIGGSGAGKSTLIDVILGLLTPTQGQVLVDGVDIQPHLRAWQNQIGYVPQSIYLTDDTLRRNVALGLAEEKIDDQCVQAAIKAAQLEDFITSLPEGLNTQVGERGVRLSGGQRQRIGIARALYHDPPVLVLDEATSSLDTATEKGVMQAVSALKSTKTILIVAHRLTTVVNCDILYRMEQGRVVKEGSYSEVMNA